MQLNTGSDPLYAALTLVLYFGTEKRWTAPRSLYEAIDIPEEFKPFVQDYRINLFEIAYLTPEQVALFKSDFRIVADYFVQKRMSGDYKPKPERMEHVQAVLQLLSVMTKDRRFEEVLIDSEEGEIQTMCEVLDKIEARGAARAVAEVNERVATDMLKEGMSLSVIEKISKLTETEIRAIAQKIGVAVVE